MIEAHLAANPALQPVLFPVRGEIADRGASAPGMLLPSGGAGLRLLYDLLTATTGDRALAARIQKELSPGGVPLADGALVSIIFDAKRLRSPDGQS